MTRKSERRASALVAGFLFLASAQSVPAQEGNGIAVPPPAAQNQILSQPRAVFNGSQGQFSPASTPGNPFGGHWETDCGHRGLPNGTRWVSDCADGTPDSYQGTSSGSEGATSGTDYSLNRPSLFAQSPAGGQSGEAAVGSGAYLDLAMPVTQLRFRFDDGFGNNFADRGEYFYAKCGCFRNIPDQIPVDPLDPNGPRVDNPAAVLKDPSAKGPPLPESNVDYQDYRTYFEYAFVPRMSAFVELPIRAINPTQNSNAAGFGDMNAGFKLALIANPYQYFTFQARGYAPTGDADRGLGTGHASVEVGFLYYEVFRERIIVQAEIKDWIPVNGNAEFASNVVEYGAGLGYVAYDDGSGVITPQIEMVGWTFNGGQKSSTTFIGSANGDTIVNFKPGIRFGWKNPGDPIGAQRNSIYAGWAHPMTNDRFYKNVLRLEYRIIY